MRHYRRYKNAKIRTLCQMNVVKPPEPTPLTEFQEFLFRQLAHAPYPMGWGMGQIAPTEQEQQTPWFGGMSGEIGRRN